MQETEKKITLSNQSEDAPLEHNGQAITHTNTHFALSVVAICLSCFAGFFTIPLAIAALILSLRAQDQLTQSKWDEAQKSAWWAGLFGWVTVGIVVLPLLALLFFSGAILAALGTLLHTM